MKTHSLVLLIIANFLPIFPALSQAHENEVWQPTSGPPIQIESLCTNSLGSVFAQGGYRLYRTTDQGETWTDISIGDVSTAVVFDDDLFVVSTLWGVFRSSDSGDSWITLWGYGSGLGLGLLAVSSDGLVLTWAYCFKPMCANVFVRSLDWGTSWDFLIYETNPGVLASHPSGVLFDAANGVVHRSTDHGTTWSLAAGGMSGTVRCFAFGADATTYCGTTLGFFVSTNTISWTRRAFDSVDVKSIAIDQEGQIFAATGVGVFESIDSGVTWTPFNDGLPEEGATSLVASPDGFLYAGTQTFGVFRTLEVTTSSDNGVNPLPTSCSLFQNYPNPFNPTTHFGFEVSDYGFVSLRIYDLLGREVATLVNEKLAPGTYARQWDATGFPSGLYFYRLLSGDYMETKKLVLLR